MGFIRTIIIISLLVAFVYFGATVKLGKRTFFGHIQNIWASDEAQDLVEGVSESGEPMFERLVRGVKRGYEEATRDAPDASPR